MANTRIGRARRRPLVVHSSLIYDRVGLRVLGIGNKRPESSQTNTPQRQTGARAQIGPEHQQNLAAGYTVRARFVTCCQEHCRESSRSAALPAHTGSRHDRELLSGYLSRMKHGRPEDTQARPQWAGPRTAAGGRGACSTDFAIQRAGVDGRGFWAAPQDTILAVHLALPNLLSRQ